MIRANEHVAEFLAGRDRPALYRVHERPDPQAVELLLAKLADLEVPTPPAPEAARPAASRRARRRDLEAGRRVRRRSPAAAARRFRRSSCARSSRRATTRATSATPGSRARRTATSPRRSAATRTSSSTARSCASSARATTRCRTTSPASPSTRRRASARRRSSSTSPTTSASRGCSRTRSRERGWEEPLGGRDHRPDRLGPLRPLRRRLRGLPPGAAPAGRVLRAEPDRDGARRPPLGPPLPARRPDRGPRRVDRAKARARSSSRRLDRSSARPALDSCVTGLYGPSVTTSSRPGRLDGGFAPSARLLAVTDHDVTRVGSTRWQTTGGRRNVSPEARVIAHTSGAFDTCGRRDRWAR